MQCLHTAVEVWRLPLSLSLKYIYLFPELPVGKTYFCRIMMIGVLGINNVCIIQHNNHFIDKDLILSPKQISRKDSFF